MSQAGADLTRAGRGTGCKSLPRHGTWGGAGRRDNGAGRVWAVKYPARPGPLPLWMTANKPEIGTQVEEKKTTGKSEKELTLDGGFGVPNVNLFGHNFRDYEAESERQEGVEILYKTNHIYQTLEFVKKMREEYEKLDKVEMSIWECCELLNNVVDESDPDLDEPQIEHLLQTAEALRKDYPNEDWLHLTALIHDLGKVLLLPEFGELPQWAVVGDTYPVGCAFDGSIVHHKYFEENPDYYIPACNTKFGVYEEGCGLDNVFMSWGHDDYMYLHLQNRLIAPPITATFPSTLSTKHALLDLSGAFPLRISKLNLDPHWPQLSSAHEVFDDFSVWGTVGAMEKNATLDMEKWKVLETRKLVVSIWISRHSSWGPTVAGEF
ncbi:inositol oxygenase 1 [Striga asiatica]|uniref:Inositol oxygenase n=1 Tax=Striga asiatica TaxID=4170 RepID=A0A5A7RAS8_STRAF|nr:inositol oxygenase 1 [Striga asiatica]